MNNPTRTGQRTMFTIQCSLTGESDTYVVCQAHAREMPLIDRDRVRAQDADDDCSCDFCPR